MTEYLVIIEGEQFLVEAPHVLAAWEVAFAQAALMRHEGLLSGEEIEVSVFTLKEAKKQGIPILFPKRLDRLEILRKVEEVRADFKKIRGGQATLEHFLGVRA